MLTFAPLHNDSPNTCPPAVFNTAFTAAEIAALQKYWQPLLDSISDNIRRDAYRPENYPAMDTTILISRILATFSERR